jgi:hypothetical protein
MMMACVELMPRAFTEMTNRGATGAAAPKEGAAVQALFEKTAGHVRDIAELISKSNADTIQLVNGRVKSMVDESRAAVPKAQSVAAE